ncbi:hypothetical protein [Fluviicola chungangensis]|uniref:Uncharacterized protein n=1 Tax=Fluviicola chungangensis TaxID=2597671 RepID=A0A556MYI7_9FLAO|nr:hypothetical protein [Fluviicola chungangensis]TSJ44849.1 hypothetical protein FO442_09635 [Fluviicola chungangensis]
MKQLLFLIILLAGKLSYADGLDEMRIYVNQKLVATSYEGASKVVELEVSVGDTLKFEIWTDWGGMENSSISVFDYQSSEKVAELARVPNRKYEANFFQVIHPGMINSELQYVYNFSPAVNRTWKFARIVLKPKTE